MKEKVTEFEVLELFEFPLEDKEVTNMTPTLPANVLQKYVPFNDKPVEVAVNDVEVESWLKVLPDIDENAGAVDGIPK